MNIIKIMLKHHMYITLPFMIVNVRLFLTALIGIMKSCWMFINTIKITIIFFKLLIKLEIVSFMKIVSFIRSNTRMLTWQSNTIICCDSTFLSRFTTQFTKFSILFNSSVQCRIKDSGSSGLYWGLGPFW